MVKIIRVIKMHSKEANDSDEYNNNPEECIDILEKLRREAQALLYGSTTTFQRIVKVIRRK